MEHTTGEFLRVVLPESGIVCVAKIAPVKGAKPEHDKYHTIDALIAGLEHANYTKSNYYFAVASFDKEEVLERGKMRFRVQTNARYLRALILDVDVKNDEGYYTSKDEAWEGIQKLVFQLNMPAPIVVDSGFGYHVYWPLLGPIPAKDWQATAKMFRQAVSVVEPKLVADASRVSDSASVLRIPGSYNLKFGQQTPVQIVQWYDGNLDIGEFRDTLKRLTGGSTDKPLVTLDVEPQEFEKAQLVATIKNCDWSAAYMKGMANASEPEWYAMLGLAPFLQHTAKDGTTIEGEQIAHMLSKNHKDYSNEATRAKYAQVQISQSGPTTCGKLQSLNSSRCANCPFKGAVKSPAVAGKYSRPVTVEQTVTATVVTDEGNKQQEEIIIPIPPKPYFRGEDGGVYVRLKEKIETDDGTAFEEKIVQVFDYDLYPVKRYRAELAEEEQVECYLRLPKDGMRRFKMPTEILVEHKRLGTFLASRGAIGEFGTTLRLAKYMTDYVRHLQTVQVAEVEYSRFGWRDLPSENPRFIVGNGFIDKDGVVHPAAFPAYLRRAATAVASHGELAKWREGFEVYKNLPNSEGYIFTACMGFAAPLMALTPYAGVLVNMVGASGAGKSAALAIMASVWGQPDAARLNVKDTQIATYNTIGYLGNVPIAFDEVTTMDPAAAADFALNFTGGRGKDRAGRDGQNKDNSISWDTIVVCSSNSSMYSKFTEARKGYNAEAMRLFEFYVEPGSTGNKGIVDAAMRALGENYGLAGREYIPVVMRNRDKIAKLIENKANDILRKTGGGMSERFWATLHACWYVGNSIARNKGLHSYDIDAVLTWTMGKTDAARENANKASADPAAMLGEFLNANISSMLRTKNGQVDLTVDQKAPHMIKGRLEYVGDKLTTAIISTKALADFCTSYRIDNSWLIEELKRAGVTNGISSPKRLATGTNWPNPTVRSYEFDMSKQLGDFDGQSAQADQGIS